MGLEPWVKLGVAIGDRRSAAVGLKSVKEESRSERIVTVLHLVRDRYVRNGFP